MPECRQSLQGSLGDRSKRGAVRVYPLRPLAPTISKSLRAYLCYIIKKARHAAEGRQSVPISALPSSTLSPREAPFLMVVVVVTHRESGLALV